MNGGALQAGLRLSAAERRQVLEAAAQLTRASVELRLTPSGRTLGLLGVLRPDDCVVDASAERQHEAESVGRTVGAVARRLPWQPTCLRQALAVQRMLHRRRIASRLHLGVTGEDAGGAHAWVTVNGRAVVGRRGIERFVPIAAFE